MVVQVVVVTLGFWNWKVALFMINGTGGSGGSRLEALVSTISLQGEVSTVKTEGGEEEEDEEILLLLGEGWRWDLVLFLWWWSVGVEIWRLWVLGSNP